MSNPLSRYKFIYDKMVRPNNAATFPRHVFVRAPNKLQAGAFDRRGDRNNCFDATMLHLTERFNSKEVFLIGTANKSTMLAQRTQKLIQEVQPDTVLVQTNNQWWDVAKLMGYVNSQEEFEHYQKQLDPALAKEMPNSIRFLR